ncbi:S-methyl-5-thioribose-1-phosphate isomerase [Pseudodesulfovibrio sp. F-1]|uniref:Methylthioribose-1-phosphate isomerase n=1 Tax=Pseudodesulfovibrio alkaliphilus TaxID=2661613 RepID=A0A7K1KIZ2_9BACT|nr:S-methyl-5-thioribose-1-phosphate isomerase [Pseudodesulfovibrio alkaliphilus]MUM76037.1 S-methyl-5-thioribose-1-phosphate isomerase [Pseudodesulfovibrio alkaliphilus]
MTEHIQYSPDKDSLILLDQRYLPNREEWFECRSTEDICFALVVMVVRGAPAIGVTAAYGCYLAGREVQGQGGDWAANLNGKLDQIENARPTAVNLRWAVREMRRVWSEAGDVGLEALLTLWLARAREIHEGDIAMCEAIGRFGGALMDDGDTIMTHCNAGALATAGYGTALGVVRGAVDQGKKVSVIANETRPFLQGARLTAYELHRDGIPVKVACDNACALLMKRGLVDKVVVGADRIAANGDAVNKIGTFGVAIMAQRFGIPFYVAAPVYTIDPETPTGDDVPIEDRDPREVTHIGDHRIPPEGVEVYNLAFDPTPNELITGIITEKGVLYPPYSEAIRKLFAEH